MADMTECNRKFLLFQLQGSLYALDLAQVAEVDDPPQLWPIPRAPACYSGAINFHGDIVAVMNLSSFLRIPGSSQPTKMIVLHQEIASLAFLVDTVVKIISDADVSLRKPPEKGFASAILCSHDGEAIQLDLEELVHSAVIDMQKDRQTPINISCIKKT